MSLQLLKDKISKVMDSLNGKYSLAIEWEGEEYQIHSHKQCPAASLIKLPILLEVYRQANVGIIDLGKTFEMNDDEKVGGAGVLNRLSAQITPTLKDLLTLMIIVSDNTATNRVIAEIGIDSVNRLCTRLGMKQTTLQRKLFDFEAAKQGLDNYTTAQDMMICIREINHSERLGLCEQTRGEMLQMLSHQQLANKIPVGIIQYDESDPFIAHKTGEVHGVEHDVGIIRLQGKEITFAILTYDLADHVEARKTLAAIGEMIIQEMN